MDSRKKFNGLAEEYLVGRPTYANEMIQKLYDMYGITENSIIADIGSGTGKLAEQLLQMGSFVYAVEPNDDMRNAAIKTMQKYEKFMAVKGDATDTTLMDNSVNFITVAQAFHWFNVENFKEECKRILKDSGKAFLIWNMRDMESMVNQESYEIYRKYCPGFKGFGGGIQKDDLRIKNLFDDNYEYFEFDNDLYYDEERFISRGLSGSYSLKPSDNRYDEYITELIQLFNKYQKNGYLKMHNKSVVYIGSVK